MSLRNSTGRSNAASVSRPAAKKCSGPRRSASLFGRSRAPRPRQCRYRRAAPSRSSWPRRFRLRPKRVGMGCRLQKPSTRDLRSSCSSLRETPVLVRYRRHPTARRSRNSPWFSGNARSRAGFDPLDRVRLRHQLAQRHPRGAARHQGDVSRGLGQRNQRRAAAIASAFPDPVVRGLDSRQVPAGGRAPGRRRAGMTSGALLPARPVCGFRSVPAAAESPASRPVGRSAVSHQGVCAKGVFFPSRAMSRQQPCGRREHTILAAAPAASPATSHHSTQNEKQEMSRPSSKSRFGEGKPNPGDRALRPF